MARTPERPQPVRDRGDWWVDELPPVDSPEFELLAREYWARPHGSPDPDWLAGRALPLEMYRWL
jgi:hypothetical protein